MVRERAANRLLSFTLFSPPIILPLSFPSFARYFIIIISSSNTQNMMPLRLLCMIDTQQIQRTSTPRSFDTMLLRYRFADNILLAIYPCAATFYSMFIVYNIIGSSGFRKARSVWFLFVPCVGTWQVDEVVQISIYLFLNCCQVSLFPNDSGWHYFHLDTFGCLMLDVNKVIFFCDWAQAQAQAPIKISFKRLTMDANAQNSSSSSSSEPSSQLQFVNGS